MSEQDARRVSLRSYTNRFRHPYLVALVGLGAVLLLGAGVLTPVAPVFAFRVGFVGAVVALFGATGYVAFWLNERGADRQGRF